MKNTMILLAGYPATGKSYLADRIIERHPGAFTVVGIDDVKEQVWDEVGFDSAEEKAALEPGILERYYGLLDAAMAEGKQIISDYPFSDKQKARLAAVSEAHGYQVLTVRLVGDPRVIYERSRSRDLKQSRHLGHMMNHYHKGDVVKDRTKVDALVSLELFLDRCANKGYDKFQLGELIEVDATDVKAIDYPALLDRIDAVLDAE